MDLMITFTHCTACFELLKRTHQWAPGICFSVSVGQVFATCCCMSFMHPPSRCKAD